MDFDWNEEGINYDSIVSYFLSYRPSVIGWDAVNLWRVLTSEDKRPIHRIGPNFWTPPRKYSFADLSRELGRKHPRFGKRILKILHRQKLVRVCVHPRRYKLEVQAWRMPAILTPFLYNQLPPILKKEHDAFIDQYGKLHNLSGKDQWFQITAHYLEPLMPGYADHDTDYDIEDNFETDQE